MVAGGQTTGDCQYLDSVYMYDVDEGAWSGPAAEIPVALYHLSMVHIPSADGIGRGQVMVAGGRNGQQDVSSVYVYNVDADTWSGPATAMPVARSYFGMVYIPSVDGVSRGQVMVAGGYNGGGNLDSVYLSAPVTTTTTSTTTTTTITTTSTTTITSSTTTTTTWLRVNVECDPLADACNASDGLVCSADEYKCRYTAGTLESQICPACTDSGSCPGSSAGVTVLAVLLVVSLAANGWFGYKNRDMAKQLQLQHVEQELGGGRRQTVEMVANPLARRSSSRPQSTAGHIAGRAAAAIPPHEQPAYSEPTSDGVPTYQSAEGASYAPVYAIYAGSTPSASISVSAAGVPLDSDNYVLDTSA